jgi:hypothetical protein
MMSGFDKKRQGGIMTTDTELVLLGLLESSELSVRLAAAENENATGAVLIRAIKDKDPKVCEAAARNSHATEAVLKRAIVSGLQQLTNVPTIMSSNGLT